MSAIKVLIEQRELHGSLDEDDLQKVATIYVGRYGEYRVYAPPKATGEAMSWAEHFCVHTPDQGGEVVVSEDAAAHIVALVKHELELQTKITPERSQYLEGAMNRLQDIAIEFFARYAAHMSKS